MAVYILLMSISQLFLGRMADVFNRKGLIIVGSLISLAFLALIPEMQNFWQLLALCIIGGVANALPVPAASALSVKEGRKYDMGSAMGVFNMGMAVGPFSPG